MQTIPVCAKPNCLHNEETDKARKKECNAYFPLSVTAGGIYYSEGQLYVLHGVEGSSNDGRQTLALSAVSADGTRRQQILTVASQLPGRSCIHRGRFYLVTQEYSESGIVEAKLWAYSLRDPGEEPILVYTTGGRPSEQNSNLLTRLYAYGSYLYLQEYLGDPQDDILGLRICDLTTGGWTAVENPEGYRSGQSAVVNGKLLCTYAPVGSSALYHAGEDVPDLKGPALLRELDGSDPQEVGFDAWGALNADDACVYLREPVYNEKQSDGNYVSSLAGSGLYFYDPEGTLLDTLPIEKLVPEEGTLVSCDLRAVQGDRLLLETYSRGGGASLHRLYSFGRSEIGTGSITPVEFFSYDWLAYTFTDNT